VNKPILRALFLDAYYQVLDNRIFRVLALLVCPLVLLTFVIGFREHGIVILWGLKTIPYEEFAGWFGQHIAPGATDVNLSFIQGVQQLVVGQLAGNLGILLSLAATAFFVPRMLEKGAADVVFSRPLGRGTLLLARYFSGVLFVTLLGSVLVLGMHLGFLLVSGASDPAFLWSILTLTYVFALIHAVSATVAVFSRSSVAAILTAVLFFTFNGCVHSTAWIPVEWARARSALTRAESGDQDAEGGPDFDHGAAGVLTTALDALHFTLPKTTDADIIVAKVRTLVSGEHALLRDPQGALLVHAPQPPCQLVEPQGEADLSRQPARWTWAGTGGPTCELVLRRESRLVDRPGDQPRKRSGAEFSRDWMTELGKRPGVEARERSKVGAPRIEFDYVAWREVLDARKLVRARGWLTSGDWVYVLELEGESAAPPGEFATERLREVARTLVVDRDDPRSLDPLAWYTRRLDWSAPLRHNIFFSIGSSVLFAALLLALAAWKLRRIDF